MSEEGEESPRRVNKLKQAYQSVFLAPNGEMPEAQRLVISDLIKYCGAGKTPRSIGPGGIDVPATMAMIGRLEVWNHMNALINIPDRDIPRMAIEQIHKPESNA